ncbi:HAD-IIA family hydrolase [Natrarchaeobius halalkaliphilus]|uniref:HAD-IIA family hydrolase n=1 Tax=Natrarchaeobius halalkaliphilus TaxID=1679091 RepID=A0A3N6NUA3_9EURY|nr:HAD-IIA family hydrolase [Natrarchaeobius halalkaliphilus]RQG86730.1 HAD-IIA family hydrolase [Natrarchaeobius halalkaliphilus]
MDGAIIDLDGTVYRSNEPIPGAVKAINRMRSFDLDIVFATNSSTKSIRTCVEKLESMGVSTNRNEILTSASVTASYVSEAYSDAVAFVIGEDPLRDELSERGVAISSDPCDAETLVVGKDRSFDFNTLQMTLNILDTGIPFIVTNPDRSSPTDSGIAPGTGAIIAAIVAASGRDPDIVVGKPNESMANITLDSVDSSPSEWLVIGDNVDTDIAMGKRAGMTTVLVQSGVDNRRVERNSSTLPDYILDSLGSINEVLNSH